MTSREQGRADFIESVTTGNPMPCIKVSSEEALDEYLKGIQDAKDEGYA